MVGLTNRVLCNELKDSVICRDVVEGISSVYLMHIPDFYKLNMPSVLFLDITKSQATNARKSIIHILLFFSTIMPAVGPELQKHFHF